MSELKLYLATVTKTLAVVASTPEKAQEVADENQGAEDDCDIQVKICTHVPQGWRGAIPFSDEVELGPEHQDTKIEDWVHKTKVAQARDKYASLTNIALAIVSNSKTNIQEAINKAEEITGLSVDRNNQTIIDWIKERLIYGV